SNMNLRIEAWWVLCGTMALALALGEAAVLVLFGIYSVLAQKEFMTVTAGGEKAGGLSRWLLLLTPLQYWLIWWRRPAMVRLLSPVLTLPFVWRVAKISNAVLACTYGLSHAPALLMLDIPGYQGRDSTLLLYFLLVAQASDVLQWIWGKLLGRKPI